MHTLMMFVVSWSVCSRLNHDTLSYLEHFYRKVLNQFYIIHTWTSNDRLSDVPHWQREDQPSECHPVCSLGFHKEEGTVSWRRLFRFLPLPWDLGNTQAYKVKKDIFNFQPNSERLQIFPTKLE